MSSRPSHPSRPARLSASSGPPNSTDSTDSPENPSAPATFVPSPPARQSGSSRLSKRPSSESSRGSGSGSGSGLRVLPLEEPSQLEPARRGRKKALEMPPLPQAILDGMTELERQHHQFFVDSIAQDYQIKKPSDFLALHMAALDFIQLLRVQAYQMQTGEVLSASKLHPGPQVRSWLDSMSTTRRARKEQPSAEDEELEKWKQGLRKISS